MINKDGHILYASMIVEILPDILQGVLLVGYFTLLQI
jgi:hypothetical protein